MTAYPLGERENPGSYSLERGGCKLLQDASSVSPDASPLLHSPGPAAGSQKEEGLGNGFVRRPKLAAVGVFHDR